MGNGEFFHVSPSPPSSNGHKLNTLSKKKLSLHFSSSFVPFSCHPFSLFLFFSYPNVTFPQSFSLSHNLILFSLSSNFPVFSQQSWISRHHVFNTTNLTFFLFTLPFFPYPFPSLLHYRLSLYLNTFLILPHFLFSPIFFP